MAVVICMWKILVFWSRKPARVNKVYCLNCCVDYYFYYYIIYLYCKLYKQRFEHKKKRYINNKVIINCTISLEQTTFNTIRLLCVQNGVGSRIFHIFIKSLDIVFQISTSVRRLPWRYTTSITPITVMLMLTVLIPRDRSTAPVIRDTQEMESRV